MLILEKMSFKNHTFFSDLLVFQRLFGLPVDLLVFQKDLLAFQKARICGRRKTFWTPGFQKHLLTLQKTSGIQKGHRLSKITLPKDQKLWSSKQLLFFLRTLRTFWSYKGPSSFIKGLLVWYFKDFPVF